MAGRVLCDATVMLLTAVGLCYALSPSGWAILRLTLNKATMKALADRVWIFICSFSGDPYRWVLKKGL